MIRPIGVNTINTPLIESISTQPSRRHALHCLAEFVPRAGQEYARKRNYDYGPTGHHHVSKLSPFIRCRAITESEVVEAVLGTHTLHHAEKFIQEVCWRTYWKGWLELRPRTWTDYLESLPALKHAYATNPLYRAAIHGETNSPTFNAFAHELTQTGYVHNHARMWMASIWIFTFDLPWQLGADLFFQHLLDGDPASNTLSWRWVAGQHTRGKCYIARSSNIEKYTEGRLGTAEAFNEQPAGIEAESAPPAIQSLSADDVAPTTDRIGWIVHEEDLSIDQWLFPETAAPHSIFIMDNRDHHKNIGLSDKVTAFRNGLLQDFAQRGESFAPDVRHQRSTSEAIRQWIQDTGIKAVLLARPSTGMWQKPVEEAINVLGKLGVTAHQQRHPWDSLCYPHATSGYFKFKKKIPQFLKPVQRDFEGFFQPRTN